MSTFSTNKTPTPAELLKPRAQNAYKHQFGHLLIIGGDHGMGGACILAAEAALRLGTGLITVASRPAHIPALLSRNPACMALGFDHPKTLLPLVQQANAIIFGVGTLDNRWTKSILDLLLKQTHCPLVIDGGALRALAHQPKSSQNRCILTPHEGEAAALLNTDKKPPLDRIDAIQTLQQLYHTTIVLKGAGTLVYDGKASYRCGHGHPSMATAGMGDVLAGMIGALCAQGIAPFDACTAAVDWHAQTAEMAIRMQGTIGFSSQDMEKYLLQWMNGRYNS